jgi:hypothetical protein
MTDQTKDTLRMAMRQLVDMAPAAPEIPTLEKQEGVRRPVAAIAAGFGAVVVVLGLGTVLLTQNGGESQDAGGSDSATTTVVPTADTPTVTTAVPDQTPITTAAPTVTVPVVSVWTIEDSMALLTDIEWDRVRAEAEPSDEYSEFWDGPAWSARDLKWHEDDLFSFTADRLLVDPGAGTRVPLERGGSLPIFGSTLLNGGTVDPESIIGNGRPLFVMVWRPSPLLVNGTEETSIVNLDAFQQAYERWGHQIDFIGVIWNEPIVEFETEEIQPGEIVNLGRQVVDKNGYTFPNVIGRVDLPQIPEPRSEMWLLTNADGRVTGGFFAHGAIRDADTALDSLPVDHLLSRLVIPIDNLADTLNERYLWAPENFGDEPGKEPLPGRCGSSVESPPGCNG